MKRILSTAAAAILALSFSASSQAATTSFLPVKSNTAKITIVKGVDFKPTKLDVTIQNPDIYVGQSEFASSVSVLALDDSGYRSEYVSDSAKITSKNTKILKIKNGFYLVPVSKGKTTISVSYKGLSIQKTVTVKPAPTGNFTILPPAGETINYIDLYYQNKIGSDPTNYYYNSPTFVKSKVKKGYKISRINWAKTPTLTGIISTGNSAYQVNLSKSQNGKTITLKKKNFAEVSLKSSIKNFSFDTLDLTKVDSKGKSYTAGRLNQLKKGKIYLPKNTYNIQIAAHAGKNYYQVYKKGLKLTKSKQTIKVSASELKKIKAGLKKTTKNSVYLSSFYTFNGKDYDSMGYQHLPKNTASTNIYLSKTYNSLELNLLVNKNWSYSFSMPINKSTINVSDNLKSTLWFNSEERFETGQKIYLDNTRDKWSSATFVIKDSYGNTLSSISGPKNSAKGVFIFKSATKTIKVPVIYNNQQITLPSTPGTYDVTFQMVK